MSTLRRSRLTRSLATLTLVLFGAAGANLATAQTVSTTQATGTTPASKAEVSYATITRTNAELRNVPDANGRVLAKLEKGSIVRVHGELAGWSKAEIPTGFAVWVYRKYVTETDDPNVVEVTRNGLNVRVLPSSGVNNYPIGQLYAGDRVRVIETPAEFAEESAEWIHIWSPPGFWAWLLTGQLELLDQGGEARWKTAQKAIAMPETRQIEAGAKSENPPVIAAADTARAEVTKEALSRAHAALERERVRTKPNFELVRSAYAAVLELDPSSEVKLLVENRLERVGMLEATATMRQELEAEKARRKLEYEQLQRDIREEAKRKDPLGDQFDERGLLERRTVGEETRYYLRWGGRDVCEVVCTSGRYDLDMFLSRDVGVRGEILPLVATDNGKTAPPIVDLRRVEIIGQG